MPWQCPFNYVHFATFKSKHNECSLLYKWIYESSYIWTAYEWYSWVLLRPFHTNPFSNESGAVLLRIRLTSTLQRRKRSPKTLSRVERFENDAFWKRCSVVWTKKTMLSENGDVMKIDTTGRQTTRPWVSKMANRRYDVASISRQFRKPIYWNAHASSSFEHAHWGYI